MKTLSVYILIFLLFSTLVFAEDSHPVAGTITFMIGDVFISSDSETWSEADFDMEIKEGEQIKTGEESRCEITLVDDTIVRIDENASQQFEPVDVKRAPKKKSIFLKTGKVWVNTRKILSKGQSFRVRTNKAVCAIRGTTFNVDEQNEYTRVHVHKGAVATWSAVFDKPKPKPKGSPMLLKPVPVQGPKPVSIEAWVEIVKALQQITIDNKGGFEKKDFDMQHIAKDPWVAWNMGRDKSASE